MVSTLVFLGFPSCKTTRTSRRDSLDSVTDVIKVFRRPSRTGIRTNRVSYVQRKGEMSVTGGRPTGAVTSNY